jgi:hypothetical protein
MTLLDPEKEKQIGDHQSSFAPSQSATSAATHSLNAAPSIVHKARERDAADCVGRGLRGVYASADPAHPRGHQLAHPTPRRDWSHKRRNGISEMPSCHTLPCSCRCCKGRPCQDQWQRCDRSASVSGVENVADSNEQLV